MTLIPLYVSTGRFCTGSAGRGPLSVIVIGAWMRHVLDPATREPRTSIPRTRISIPLASSPMINDEVLGIVMTPSNSDTVFLMTTLLFAGNVTAPDVGTMVFGQVLGECQSSNPVAKCGQLVRDSSKLGTFGCGITIRSEYPDGIYSPNGGRTGGDAGDDTGAPFGAVGLPLPPSSIHGPQSQPDLNLGSIAHVSRQVPSEY